jgi:acyl-CoA reductase-like NAD-dependent aldehyde dehydrogenase
LIGDRRISDASGGVHRHVYAATGKVTGEIPLAGAAEIDLAVHAARSAAASWARTPGNERRNLMLRFAELLEREAVSLGQLAMVDNSLIGAISNGGPYVAADLFRYNAGWADKIGGDVIATWPQPALDYTYDESYGVVAVIIPWNGPVYAMGMVLSPVLAAGNCVVVKPPELAPYACLRLGELFLEAGFPAGVVNIVPGGPDAGRTLVEHAGIDKIHFTGSGATAQHILRSAAKRLVPVQLELGGKSASLVFEDADLDAFEPFAISGIVGGAGQGCINATRLLVQSSIYDEVVERASRSARTTVVGDPADATSQMGPVIDETAVNRIMGMIDTAKQGKARLVAGGERLVGEHAGGYYIEPTVFADVTPDMELANCEVFGPVLAISRFDTYEDAIAIANGTEFGLAAYVWTRDVRTTHRAARDLVAGNVWVNGFTGIPGSVPFGGTRQSGYGRLGGIHGIREFTRPKNVWVGL